MSISSDFLFWQIFVPLGEGILIERVRQTRVPPVKSRHFTAIGSYSVKTVAHRHRHPWAIFLPLIVEVCFLSNFYNVLRRTYYLCSTYYSLRYGGSRSSKVVDLGDQLKGHNYYMTSYQWLIVILAISRTVSEMCDLTVENRHFSYPHWVITPSIEVTRFESLAYLYGS